MYALFMYKVITMETIQGSAVALKLLVARLSGFPDVPFFPGLREQNAFAGQLRDERNVPMFPGKRGKQAFAAFMERCSNQATVAGDGDIALAAMRLSYSKKMRDWSREGSTHFSPVLDLSEAQQIVSDVDLQALLTAAELMQLGALVECLKKDAFRKVTRT
jgi:hypothetical protein